MHISTFVVNEQKLKLASRVVILHAHLSTTCELNYVRHIYIDTLFICMFCSHSILDYVLTYSLEVVGAIRDSILRRLYKIISHPVLNTTVRNISLSALRSSTQLTEASVFYIPKCNVLTGKIIATIKTTNYFGLRNKNIILFLANN